jgi:hypothetical protein
MSRQKYNSAVKACRKAYENDGVQAAINEANKRGYTKLAHCSPCETNQPVIAEKIRLTGTNKTIITSDCAVCGSTVNHQA